MGRGFVFVVIFGGSLACGGRAQMAMVDDGSVAMLKAVEHDCGQPILSQPEHCVWTRPLDTQIERVIDVHIELSADGIPAATESEGDDRGATRCAMALRFGAGPGACTVRLRLARYVTDVGPARRIDPSVDCSGQAFSGPGAGCATSAGPAPLR